MNNYKYVDKYLKNKKRGFSFKKVLIIIFSQVLICIILLLLSLIVLKYDSNNSNKIHDYLNSNINMSYFRSLYDKYLGDIIPFSKIFSDNSALVFNEKLEYTSLNIYKDGVSLEVSENYLVPSLDEGIVVFIGDKDDYGKTVIIEQSNGVYVWYGNMNNINVNIYDYVEKNEFIGDVNNNLYLVFKDEENILDYKDFIK